MKKPLTVTSIELVTLAVARLGGDVRAIDTEDVAVLAHQMSSQTFSWRKYPEQINLELVRVALSDAKKAANGALLIGAGREGWRLSTAGLAWFSSRGQELLQGGALSNTSPQNRRRAGSIDSVRMARELQRLKSTRAWDAWISKQPIAYADAKEVFRVDDYADRRMLEIKLVRLTSLLESDRDAAKFLEVAAAQLTREEHKNDD